jgi:hypothetical protein
MRNLNKFLDSLEKSKSFWFSIFVLFLFFLLRLPSLFEPIWYGDEGIYQVIGNSLNNGKLLYKEIFDNKPPLLYYLYAAVSSDQFSIRLLSLISGTLSVIAFFLLSQKLFTDKKNIVYATTLIFALLYGLPILEGNIANAENFMTLPILIAGLLVFNKTRFFIAGLLLGIAFLIKTVAIFDFMGFAFFYFLVNAKSEKKNIEIYKILSGFLTPLAIVSLFFVIQGTFIDFVSAVFTSNISYVNFANNIWGIPILLFFKISILGIFLAYIFNKRKNFDKAGIFILLWFAFSIFNAFFSQRPYTHYLLVLLPSFSLLIGLIFTKKQYRKLLSVFALLVFIVIFKVFGVPNYSKSISYYHNFTQYLAGANTTSEYRAFFDKNTPVDYEIARFIRPKLNKTDTIFVWGNNAQLYQLTNVIAPSKYIVAYHMLSYEDGIQEAQKTIANEKPKSIIVIEKNPPFSLEGYSEKIRINNAVIYERSIY